MCGRFTLIDLSQFTNLFPWILPPDSEPPPRYNIAPSQAIAVVPNAPEHKIDYFLWGLIPSWAKDPAIGNRMINARAETLAEKPAFRTALRRRRCLIPASGFYEWQKTPDGRGKRPFYLTLKSQEPFAFAGLWDTWHDPGGAEINSCTIITVPPNKLLASIHDRMPAMLLPEACEKWVDPAEHPPQVLQELLKSYPADQMAARPVSRLVNNPKAESPQCLASPAEEAPGLFPPSAPDS